MFITFHVQRREFHRLTLVKNGWKAFLMITLKKVTNLMIILLSLWVVDVEKFHVKVSRIWKSWESDSYLFEITWTCLRISLVNNVTVTHQNQSVETKESLRAWLMNCSDYSLAFYASFYKSFTMFKALKLSNPEVGSSRRIKDGSVMSSTPIAVLFLSPPEIVLCMWDPTGMSATLSRPSS